MTCVHIHFSFSETNTAWAIYYRSEGADKAPRPCLDNDNSLVMAMDQAMSDRRTPDGDSIRLLPLDLAKQTKPLKQAFSMLLTTQVAREDVDSVEEAVRNAWRSIFAGLYSTLQFQFILPFTT